VLWVLAAGLPLTGSPRRAVIGVAAAVAVGVVLGIVHGAQLGLLAAYVGTIAAIAVGWWRNSEERSDKAIHLPSPGLLFLEGAPYAAFGATLAVLLIEPHVLGWEGHVNGSTASALATLELSFMLALPPLVLGSALHERIMRSVWTYMGERRERGDAAAFRHDVTAFFAGKAAGALAIVVALAGADFLIVETVRRLGGLTGLSQLVFVSALAGFVLLWLGQLGCLLMLSLSRPAPAVVSALAATCALAAVGIPLVLVDYRLAAPAFVIGTAVFAAVALAGNRRLLRRADYHYATAF
jgi:hypothetical protein